MIDKALPFHLPVKDVLQLGRDSVGAARSFTFGPHQVPVGRVRCLGTIVSIVGAASPTPGAGGVTAAAGAALQHNRGSASDGIAGDENERADSSIGGAIAVELDDGTGTVLVHLTAAIVRRLTLEVGKVVDIVGSVVDGAASPPTSSAAPADSSCTRCVELTASHLWPVPWPAAKRQRSTDMAQLLKDCYANSDWCAARKARRDIGEPDDAMQVFFPPVAATKARAPAPSSTPPTRSPPSSKQQSSGSSSASLSSSSSFSASSSWKPTSSKSAARPLPFNASSSKRITAQTASKPTPQQVRQQHQQQEWRRLYQQRQRKHNQEEQSKQQREHAQGYKRQRSQSPPNRLLSSSSSSSSASLSSSTHPISRMKVPCAEPSSSCKGSASASSENRPDSLKDGNSNGGQHSGQERSLEDTYDFYDIPSQSSQETPSRDNKKGGVSQNFLRGDALSPRSTGRSSNKSTRKEKDDRRKLNEDSSKSSSSSSSSSSSRWSIGSSQGSQGPGLTAVSEPLLRVIEAAAKTASRGAHLDQLHASAPHLSPNDLVAVLQDLQMGGFIYMTGAGAYTAL